MSYNLPKSQRIKRQKTIDLLFSQGKTLSCFPLKLVFLEETPQSFEIGFSVPKRHIKYATKRNRIKRKIKEAFRLHKNIFLRSDFLGTGFFIYTSKMTDDEEKIESAVQSLLKQWNSFMVS